MIGMEPDREPTGIPRWLKVLGIVLGVLALLAVAMLLIDGGGHGPARHTSATDPAISLSRR